jgi:hypothetical protein
MTRESLKLVGRLLLHFPGNWKALLLGLMCRPGSGDEKHYRQPTQLPRRPTQQMPLPNPFADVSSLLCRFQEKQIGYSPLEYAIILWVYTNSVSRRRAIGFYIYEPNVRFGSKGDRTQTNSRPPCRPHTAAHSFPVGERAAERLWPVGGKRFLRRSGATPLSFPGEPTRTQGYYGPRAEVQFKLRYRFAA